MKSLILSMICLTTPLLAVEKIKVLLNPNKDEMVGALSVIFDEEQTVTQQAQYFKYKVINRTKQNIFVVIDNGENRASVTQVISRNKDGEITDISDASAGGSSLGLASTHQTLRLLYAPRLEDGNITSGRNKMAAETKCICRVNFGSMLSRLNQSKGILTLTVGFYATNAKGYQIESFRVPVKVTFKKEETKPQPKKMQNKSQ